MPLHLYLSHPQVRIDPAVPVPRWGLSDIGRARVERLAEQAWIQRFRRVVSSDEQKAVETADVIAAALGVTTEVFASLHETDRSATGFLPPPEFEATADLFFGNPEESIRGWERAADAQARIIGAVMRALAAAPDTPTIFTGHGGVGTLLWCHCARVPISRIRDQKAGGGNHYMFDLEKRIAPYGWRPMEEPPPPGNDALTT
ncbi:MAG: histidine phosphatase family protein [Beijerinckiaceae bacterium]